MEQDDIQRWDKAIMMVLCGVLLCLMAVVAAVFFVCLVELLSMAGLVAILSFIAIAGFGMAVVGLINAPRTDLENGAFYKIIASRWEWLGNIFHEAYLRCAEKESDYYEKSAEIEKGSSTN